MADGAQVSPRRYSAFISYTHRDVAAAKRLQHQLETYKLPARVAVSAPEGRLRGRRLKPIFRDISDLSAEHDLSAAIREALAQSDNLIVVCSPRSAQSEWVGREIEYFRALHGDAGVRAALVDGEAAEALHPALKKNLRGAEIEPLAADFTKAGPGRKLSTLKLVAGMAGVRLDELVQRDAQRKMRLATAGSGIAFLGLGVVAILALLVINADASAQREQARSKNITKIVTTDIRPELRDRGQVGAVTKINNLLLDAHRGDPLTKDEQLERAEVLRQAADNEEVAGRPQVALTYALKAWGLTKPLIETIPNDPQIIYSHAQSEYYIAFVNWRLGNVALARNGFATYYDLARRLPATKLEWILEPAYAESNIGMLALRQAGDSHTAERHFERALRTFKWAAQRRPGNVASQLEVADAYAWLADARRVSGDLAGATAIRADQRKIIDILTKTHADNINVRMAALSNELAIARIDADKGYIHSAIGRISAAHAESLRITASAPEHRDAANQSRMLSLFEARLQLSLGKNHRVNESSIRKVLGSCDETPLSPSEIEIQQYCFTILARLLRSEGKSNYSRRIIDSMKYKFGNDKYTLRWGIDLNSEMRS